MASSSEAPIASRSEAIAISNSREECVFSSVSSKSYDKSKMAAMRASETVLQKSRCSSGDLLDGQTGLPHPLVYGPGSVTECSLESLFRCFEVSQVAAKLH